MRDLLTDTDSPYKAIYGALRELREAFHREGRIGDSNAKLDETVKFLAIHYANAKGLLPRADYQRLMDRRTFTVDSLNQVFGHIATRPPFSNAQLGSIFGARPATAFESGDEGVAFELLQASACALTAQSTVERPLDLLNEAFGHHVRDNFRSHIEDAQYMTPPEVVEFMTKLAAEMVFSTAPEADHDEFVMVDPSCGVGSFMTSWRREYDRRREASPHLKPLLAIGQDKVERMVRLSAMNLIFSENDTDQVAVGNSLVDDSPLDAYNGKVDVILTNPPFGAKFASTEVRKRSQRSTPFFAQSSVSQRTIDSELLFIDRYIQLLRPGGVCLAIVPDGVVSAKGQAAYLRQHLARTVLLRGVIELPPVTFSQAGTRTKTAILMFQKCPDAVRQTTNVFFGEAYDLGFEVSKRKGVPIKRHEGRNQLPDILDAYRAGRDGERHALGKPLIALWREIDPKRHEAWTPRQFAVDSQGASSGATQGKTVLKPIIDLIEPPSKRIHARFREGTYFISVLHVIGEGVLDIAGVRSYAPITPGIQIKPGEVIVSRINPRIPRVLVVPDLGRPLLCSSEFEVLRPKRGISPYQLAYLLLSSTVQEQIHSMTSGTSASHSRVKPAKIYQIHIPWPANGGAESFDAMSKEYEASMKALLNSLSTIHELRQQETEILQFAPTAAENSAGSIAS